MEMKPKTQFGQMPILELDDGTQLAQSKAILQWVGRKHNLVPQDAMANYKGQCAEALLWDDCWSNIPKAIWAKENREAMMEEVFSKDVPNFFTKFETCLGDSKFLCGDELTVYDFSVGGVFTNLILNPNAKDAEGWKKAFEAAPERVKKYALDFQAAMKEYLDKRGYTNTM